MVCEAGSSAQSYNNLGGEKHPTESALTSSGNSFCKCLNDSYCEEWGREGEQIIGNVSHEADA